MTICFILFIYSIYLYFNAYDSPFFQTKAIVIEADCNKFTINRHANEYHCVLGIEYEGYSGSQKKYRSSLTFVDNEKFHIGDEIIILVDKNNPMNIGANVIDEWTKAIILCIIVFLLMIVATGTRFIEIA